MYKRQGEASVRLKGHGAPLGPADDGVDHVLPLRVSDLQFAVGSEIFVGFQCRVLRHGGLVFLAPDADGHGGGRLHAVGIDGQVAHLGGFIQFGQAGRKGHLRRLFGGENVAGDENADVYKRQVLHWGADKKYIGKFFSYCLEKGEAAGHRLMKKAGRGGLFVALMLFVGIPIRCV